MATSAFTDSYVLATDKGFVERVQMAAVSAALALMADLATDSRLASYCAALLNSPAQFAHNLAFGVAANPAMHKDSSDSDLQWTVNSVVHAYAGVLPKAG